MSEIAQVIGTALGAAAATAGAVWGALVRPMHRRLNEATEAARAPDPELAILRQRLADVLDRLDKFEERSVRRLEKVEERSANSVTDDEFEAYTNTTNKSVQALTEKIGSATGAIEAWYRLQNQGR